MTETVTVQRINLFVGHGRLRPFKWTYKTVGPDGRLFTNDSIVELRRVLKKAYGREVVIVEPWKAER